MKSGVFLAQKRGMGKKNELEDGLTTSKVLA